MKNISEEFKNILSQEVVNLVRCWKLSTKQGDTIAFTTSSESFEYDNILFNSINADDIRELANNIDIEDDNVELSNLISSDLITANDILSGKYDGAKVEIFLLDYLNLDKGKISLLNGRISDIKFKNNLFIANVRGLKNEIDKVIGEVYGPLCRCSLCDSKCGLNKEYYTYSGKITSIIDSVNFITDNSIICQKTDEYFEYGVIEFTSGENINQKTEIKQFTKGQFTLSLELPYNLNVGDSFKVIAGCDKQFETCCNRFNNAINFRGEPHLPGIELLLKVM